MKRTAVNHNKTTYLQTLLKRPPFHVLGVLESIWQLTAKDFPRGNIGKISNERIAGCIGWDGDPNELVNALEMSGFLDPHPEHRLVVHDWSHHCEDSIHCYLARKFERFADGTVPKFTRLTSLEKKGIVEKWERILAGEKVDIPKQGTLFPENNSENVNNAHTTTEVHTMPLPLPLPLPLPTDIPPTPTPDPKPKNSGGNFLIPEKLQTAVFQEAWTEFLNYNAALRAPFVRHSLERLLTQFAEWGPDASTVALHATILSGGKLIKKPDKVKNPVPQTSGACSDCGSVKWSSRYAGGCNLCRDDYGKRKAPG